MLMAPALPVQTQGASSSQQMLGVQQSEVLISNCQAIHCV